MDCDSGIAPTESVFMPVFATTICWARQNGNGKRYKRLVYFGEQTDTEQKKAPFFNKLDERLQGLCVLDEEHSLHREYTVLVRCERFRTRESDVGESRPINGDVMEAEQVNEVQKAKTRKPGALPGGEGSG